ncbi:MAG: putative baseplate assembly protein [Methylocella sp.]
MPLPDKNLDDRTFEDIFNEARRRIVTYTPEWTDYNDSDPGITLLQLAAFLQEMIIWRLNQVPEKNYQKFLELVGLNLLQPATAHADLTFTLSKGAVSQNISAGTQVGLAGGSGTPILFETDVPLTAVGLSLQAVQSFDGSQFTLQTVANAVNGPPGYPALSNTPQSNAALYLGFDLAFPAGTHRLTIYLGSSGTPAPVQGGGSLSALPSAILVNGCVSIVPGTTNPLATPSPPVQGYWEYWSGPNTQWQRLILVSDSTQALTQSGAVLFTAPPDAQATQLGLLIKPTDPARYWIRFRIDQVIGSGYPTPPIVEGILLNTVPATNAVTEQDVLLGAANGLPNQTVQLPLFPVLPLPTGVTGIIAIDEGDGNGYVTWTEVEDFASSGPNDQVYTLDHSTGLVSFGDGVNGAIPSYLSGNANNSEDADQVNIKATSYQYGGGTAGNTPPGTITTLLTPFPYVSSVTNQRASFGGADEETIAQAQDRAPKVLRTSNRAVTGEDFAFLALQTPGARLARAEAFPLLNPNFRVTQSATGGPPQAEVQVPGTVTVIVVPQSTTSPNPMPSGGILQLVKQWLDQYRLLTVELYVAPPHYREVTIQASVIAQPTADAGIVEAAVVNALLSYFNPLTGGPNGTGWDFGGKIYFSQTYRRILDIPGVYLIVTGSLKTFVDGVLQPTAFDVALQPDELAYSLSHDITVSYPS